ALRHNAAAVVLAHSHPSGDPTPSPEDLAVTRHLGEAGRLLGIEVLDHLVISAHRFHSLRSSGGWWGWATAAISRRHYRFTDTVAVRSGIRKDAGGPGMRQWLCPPAGGRPQTG